MMLETTPEDIRSKKFFNKFCEINSCEKNALFGGFCIIMHKLWIIMHNYVIGKWKRKVSANILRKPHVDWGSRSRFTPRWTYYYSHQRWALQPPVSDSVRIGPFASYHTSRAGILIKLGNYLKLDILRILTEPFFRKKNFNDQKFEKNCFFDHSVNFLVNFLSEDFAQNFRNDNLEG